MSTKNKNGSPTRASQIMSQFIPEEKSQLQSIVDEVSGIRESAHGLVASVAQYANVVDSPEVRNHPELDDIIRFTTGIVNDSKHLQEQLIKVDKQYHQLLALPKTDSGDQQAILPKSIQVSQDYHDVISQWDLTVKPNIDSLTALLLKEGIQ